ncbi:MAG: hypothetical protein ABIE43_00715 [Patescibacteria group bacterium]
MLRNKKARLRVKLRRDKGGDVMSAISQLPKDVDFSKMTISNLAGGIKQGEVLKLLIEGVKQGMDAKFAFRRFREKIFVNDEMGVRIGFHFLMECLADLKKRELVLFDDKKVWLTSLGMKAKCAI